MRTQDIPALRRSLENTICQLSQGQRITARRYQLLGYAVVGAVQELSTKPNGGPFVTILSDRMELLGSYYERL